jgi:hypothetical protein
VLESKANPRARDESPAALAHLARARPLHHAPHRFHRADVRKVDRAGEADRVPDSVPLLAPPVARIVTLMESFPGTWALCGGWAVDAWIGHATREHHDVEVAIFQEDQRAVFDLLAGWRLLGHDDAVADDCSDPWDGRRLDLPAHVHARAPDGFEAEVYLNERADGHWVLRRTPFRSLPLVRAISRSPWGIPTVAPEIVLYYKALQPMWRDQPRKPPRPHDEHDLQMLRPILTASQRAWLLDAIASVDANHPWVTRRLEAPQPS